MLAPALLSVCNMAAAGLDVILDVDVNGNLHGASNVLVDGVYYDVQFVEGTCVSVYDGCDEPEDFPFPPSPTSGSLAGLALSALEASVLIDIPGVGNFDSSPHLTNGCFIHPPALQTRCVVLLPYSGTGAGGAVNFPAAFWNDSTLEDPLGVGGFISFPADVPGGQWVEDTALTWSTWTLSVIDSDGDGVVDGEDNCSLVVNPAQRDTNEDGVGNVCDGDIDNNCIVNFLDYSGFPQAFGSTDGDPNYEPDREVNGDGLINFLDIGIYPAQFGGPPGPSANACVPARGLNRF